MSTPEEAQRTWGIPGALPANPGPYLALAAALEDVPPVPCRTIGNPISDDWEARQKALEACSACPVLDLCRQAGEQEHHGVWGGIDRTPKRSPKKPKEAAA